MINPTKNNVLVELDKLPDKTESGFYLARVTKNTRGGDMREYTRSPVLYGTVKAIGPDVVEITCDKRVTFIEVNCWKFGEDALINEKHILALV